MNRQMWKPNDESTHWEAPPGVAPWRELSDAEFVDLNERFGPGLERFFDRNQESGVGRGGRVRNG